MTIQTPLDPARMTGKSITTNKITQADFRKQTGHTEPKSPKSNLVILAVAALIIGWLIVFAAIFTAAIPIYACGFATILASNVLAILSLRE